MNSELYGQQLDLLTPFTTVLWIGCVAIGVGGYWLVTTPPMPTKIEAPTHAELLHVQVTKSPLAPPMSQAPQPANPAATSPPAPLPLSAPPTIDIAAPPALTPLAAINPIVACAPTTTAALTTAVQNPPPPSAPVLQQLTFGQDEGQQPSPEYPREAQIDRQQGDVVVRFSVDAAGNVHDVSASAPCRWPLLNQAALRAVRETWQFSPGAPRLYEVRISFQIKRDD